MQKRTMPALAICTIVALVSSALAFERNIMTDAILVLNAGSSSLKFSVFLDCAHGEPQLALRGQIENILTLPR